MAQRYLMFCERCISSGNVALDQLVLIIDSVQSANGGEVSVVYCPHVPSEVVSINTRTLPTVEPPKTTLLHVSIMDQDVNVLVFKHTFDMTYGKQSADLLLRPVTYDLSRSYILTVELG